MPDTRMLVGERQMNLSTGSSVSNVPALFLAIFYVFVNVLFLLVLFRQYPLPSPCRICLAPFDPGSALGSLATVRLDSDQREECGLRRRDTTKKKQGLQ